jgi:guanylate kinase
MKDVIETEKGLTLKSLRLKWFDLAGQYLTNGKDIEAHQMLRNNIDTVPRTFIAFKESTDLDVNLEKRFQELKHEIKERVSGHALEEKDSERDIVQLNHERVKELQTGLWTIFLNRGLLETQ